MTHRTLTMAGILALAGALLFPSGLRADEQQTALTKDDLECPDAVVFQPPIEIGPCNPTQVCWKVAGPDASAEPPPSQGSDEPLIASQEEPDCKLRGDLHTLDIGHLCVFVAGRSYPAQAASYTVLSASTKQTETVLVQRNKKEFRWPLSACADLGKCDAGHGGGGNKCKEDGVPHGA